jgi:CubicO group peptidase (beta-lactamase class C family)
MCVFALLQGAPQRYSEDLRGYPPESPQRLCDADLVTDSPGTVARLPPLPRPLPGAPWPGVDWPTGALPPGVDLGPLMDAAFDPDGPLRDTYAVVCILGGRLVAERYGGTLPRFDGPGRPVTAATPLLSWSMAKSMLHALVGMLVGDGVLDPAAPADVRAWGDEGDPRRVITLSDLLAMRDGLAFVETYEDPDTSDVLQMLFGQGKADMAAFAAERPLVAAPGTRYNYSTGTSMVISGVVAGALGPGDPYRSYLDERLFGPLGMSSATATFDDAGSWVAGSYVYATARDFARFGLLYLRDGVWDGRRLLPEGWVDSGRTSRSVDPDDGYLYGHHWWTRDDPLGTFWAAGHDGQYIDVVPGLDLVLVRLGRTGTERTSEVRTWRDDMIEAFRGSHPGAGGA